MSCVPQLSLDTYRSARLGTGLVCMLIYVSMALPERVPPRLNVFLYTWTIFFCTAYVH